MHPQEHTKFKGSFEQGRKTGKFYVEKLNEKYIGFLEDGLYQGEGRLTTDNWIYEGEFDRGEKNGYGEEYYPKTGVRLTGNFQNGVLCKHKPSKSISELRGKGGGKAKGLSSERERLERVRRLSLEKHNTRMHRMRDRRMRDSEYEMQLDTQE